MTPAKEGLQTDSTSPTVLTLERTAALAGRLHGFAQPCLRATLLFTPPGARAVPPDLEQRIERAVALAGVQIQRLPERAHQQGFAQARHAFQQAMAAGQQADQQLLDDRILANDGFGDGFAQMPATPVVASAGA